MYVLTAFFFLPISSPLVHVLGGLFMYTIRYVKMMKAEIDTENEVDREQKIEMAIFKFMRKCGFLKCLELI